MLNVKLKKGFVAVLIAVISVGFSTHANAIACANQTSDLVTCNIHEVLYVVQGKSVSEKTFGIIDRIEIKGVANILNQTLMTKLAQHQLIGEEIETEFTVELYKSGTVAMRVDFDVKPEILIGFKAGSSDRLYAEKFELKVKHIQSEQAFINQLIHTMNLKSVIENSAPELQIELNKALAGVDLSKVM